MGKNFKFKYFLNPIMYLILTIIFLEICLKLFLFKQLNIIYPIILSVGIIYLISTLFIFKYKYCKIVFSIMLFILCGYYIGQLLYYDFFKTFFTIYSLTNSTQIIEFYKDILYLIKDNIIPIIILFIPFILFVMWGYKYIHFIPFKKQKLFLYVIAVSICYILSYATLYLPSSQHTTALEIYKEKNISIQSVNRLGLLTSLKLDISSLLFDQKDNIANDHNDEIIQQVSKYDAQIMDINFDKMINEATDSTIKDMHYYFKNKQPTYKNKYTGMFKDYNVIWITCEGLSHYAIREDVTPTLYKMANEGFVFDEFYTPLWGVSTSDGEYVGVQSLIPKEGVWSFQESSNNSLPFVMGQQLKKKGYTSKAYHNHSYKYYGRHLSHPNLGYDYKGVGNGLNIKKQWPESDLEMIEKTVDEYVHDDHFSVYYMTVSGHTNYSWIGNSMANKNRDKVQHLDYSELCKGYFATQIELDKAMEKLLSKLHESNKDNTLIIMSADHYPYGLPSENYNELAGHEIEQNFELYRNAFIIYSPMMKEPIHIDKLGSSLDILPTVSNLLGIEYDSRLLMGRDILSNQEPLIIFQNKSFITDRLMYNAHSDEIKWLNDNKEDLEYFKKIKNEVKQKFHYSKLVLEKNYYKYLKIENK